MAWVPLHRHNHIFLVTSYTRSLASNPVVNQLLSVCLLVILFIPMPLFNADCPQRILSLNIGFILCPLIHSQNKRDSCLLSSPPGL
ncbi:hypothetical protein FKM82_025131 [Ascaphus truei]